MVIVVLQATGLFFFIYCHIYVYIWVMQLVPLKLITYYLFISGAPHKTTIPLFLLMEVIFIGHKVHETYFQIRDGKGSKDLLTLQENNPSGF